ncbi:hypothetical protein NMG60_11004902 [Bertholletia excelsa]
MKSPSPTSHSHGLKVAVVASLICSLSFLPSKSVGLPWSSYRERKVVVGSTPPRCINKCMNCNPCMATLVIPPGNDEKVFRKSSHGSQETYYLLAWKCKCGNKLFEP